MYLHKGIVSVDKMILLKEPRQAGFQGYLFRQHLQQRIGELGYLPSPRSLAFNFSVLG